MRVFQGSTDQSLTCSLLSSGADPAPIGSVTLTSLTIIYIRDRSEAVSTSVTALASATAAHTGGGAYELASPAPGGQYRFDIPDAAFAAGADRVKIMITGSQISTFELTIDLVDDNIDSTGGTLRLNKAIEAILAQLAGESAGKVGDDVEYKGLDGETTVLTVTYTGPGVRTGSVIS